VPRYMIVRTFDCVQEEMPVVGRRSRELVESDFPQIVWEHSHIVVDQTGKVRSFCVYDAPDMETVKAHSSRLGQHEIDSIDEIAGDVSPADFPPV
jgi:hypothetical protein